MEGHVSEEADISKDVLPPVMVKYYVIDRLKSIVGLTEEWYISELSFSRIWSLFSWDIIFPLA